MHPALLSWLVAAMLAWVPPAHGKEGPEAQRYAEIARTALEVSFDTEERPLFDGPHGRSKTALQLVAIAGFESFYRHDVQMGDKRGKVGDGCLMQVVISGNHRLHLTALAYEWLSPKEAENVENAWVMRDLIGENTENCFRAGLHMARESFMICHDLSMYTAGQCNHDIKAKHRYERARMHYAKHPATISDAEVMLEQGDRGPAKGGAE
jgi:hypothetical protein